MQHVIETSQIEEVLKVLAEIPAKFSFGVIDMMRKLPVHEEHNGATSEPIQTES